MRDRKGTSGKLLNLLSFPVRLINDKVKSADPDPEAAGFTNRYLQLADKALHPLEEPAPASPAVARTLRLRIEPADGSPAKDYRIERGEIEVRLVAPAAAAQDEAAGWRRLSPEELAQHVRNNTLVAHWLEERLGWRKMLQKCAPPSDKEFPPAA